MTPIPLARPQLDHREAEAVRAVLATGWITQGPEVAAFEQAFAAAVGAAHACAVSSCTAALHLALVALGIGPGDEVITPSHSFIATANCLRYVGAVPVLVEVEAATGNLDPAAVAAALGPRTRALLVVHQLGMPCDLGRLLPLAAAAGLPVIEDAACAIGSEIERDGRWQRLGRPHGVVACFSFHPRKVLSTGDGGMLTTADPELDQSFRRLRQHGMTVSDRQRHAAATVVVESYDRLGFNYRMTDIQAAVGRVQLSRLDAIVAERRQLAQRYHRLLAGLPGVTVPTEPAWARSNWQSYQVRLSEAVDQRAVMQALLDHGIASRRGVMCAHREPAYRDQPELWRHPGPLTVGEALQDHGLILPLFPGLSHDDQDRVVATLAAALAEG